MEFSQQLRRSLPRDVRAPQRARYSLDGLREALPGWVLDDLKLLVTELVTNSLSHAGGADDGSIDLRVDLSGSTVRIEILDGGHRYFQAIPENDPLAESGRGLLIVDRLATRWGTEVGQTQGVWFELEY